MSSGAGREATWRQTVVSLVIVLLLLGVVAAFIWFLIRQISKLDSNVAAASIGATATVLVSAIAVFAGRYLERKRDLETAAREKRIPLYEDFIAFWFRQLYADRMGEAPPSSEELMKAMVDFTRASTVWASDEVILKWSEVRRRFAVLEALREALEEAGAEPQGRAAVEPLFIFEEFLLAIRRDTGYPKTKLATGDLLGMFIDDIGEYLKVLQEEREAAPED